MNDKIPNRFNGKEEANNYKETVDSNDKTKMSKQVHRFGTVGPIKGPSNSIM